MVALVLMALGGVAHAAYLYDMGKPESAVRAGFQPVRVDSAYSDAAGFGWESAEGLEAQAQAFKEPVANASRGTMDPPPIYTNELTEDSIQGAYQTTFLAKVPAGKYEVHVLCGTSAGNRSQFWDFTVSVGDESAHVQIEGAQRFVWETLPATAGEEPLAVRLDPLSRWCVNAILIVGEEEKGAVAADVIAPLKQGIFVLPPEEWAKWTEDVHVDTRLWPPIPPADQRRGYVIHHRHYLEPIWPNTVPLEHTLNPELRAFASLGEYEPLTFTVWPLKALRGAKVTVSDLRSGNGTIPSGEIDVRRVGYMLCRLNYSSLGVYRRNPDTLLHFESLDLPARENQRFWLTVHVPEAARPGLYRGKATFSAEGVPNADVPILLRVLPIRLQEDPSKLYGIYYYDPLDRAASAPDDVSRAYFERKSAAEHADMVAHGTRNVTMSVWSPAADAEGRFSFNYDLLARKIEAVEEHGFRPPIVMGFNVGDIYRKHMGESFGVHLRGVKQPPAGFAAEVTAAVGEIERERKARGWPEFVYYPVDEPDANATSVEFMATVLKACKAVPGVRTYVTADPTAEAFEPLRPFIDIWCTQPFAPDRETVLADSQARGVEYWCYPNHVSGENDHTPVAGARMTYGFGLWRSGFRTLIPWIYQSSSGDPYNYLDGRNMDFFNRQEPDGTPVPVTLWEAFREGYDDYRYLYTLEQLIAQARQAGKAAQADRAQKELGYVWDSIRVQTKYKYDDLWGPEEFDAYRWVVAQQVMELQGDG